MRVTMKDVARRAEVSIATVSLVLNDAPGISLATREHVRNIIRELKYTPDAQARRFSSGRTGTVGLVMPPWSEAFSDPYFLSLMRGTLEAVRDRGYQMLLEVSDERFLDHRLWNDLFAGRRVDGLIIATPYLDQAYLFELVSHRYPTMLVNGERADLPELDFVGYDDVQCGLDATSYLLSLGHRRIAHVSGALNHASAIHRREGYRKAMADAGVAVDPRLEVVGEYLPLEGRDAFRPLLELPADQRPTAIFCANDTMAMSIIQYLQENGLSVPGDFSVVGVDDTGAAAKCKPALTTFRQDIFGLARRAAALFLEKIETKTFDQPLVDRPKMEFVERASCAPYSATTAKR